MGRTTGVFCESSQQFLGWQTSTARCINEPVGCRQRQCNRRSPGSVSGRQLRLFPIAVPLDSAPAQVAFVERQVNFYIVGSAANMVKIMAACNCSAKSGPNA